MATKKKKNDKADEVLKTVGDNSAAQIKSYVERIERIREEKKAYTDDEREVFAELKSNGFDAVAIREVLKLRKLDQPTLESREFLRGEYARAAGISCVADLA